MDSINELAQMFTEVLDLVDELVDDITPVDVDRRLHEMLAGLGMVPACCSTTGGTDRGGGLPAGTSGSRSCPTAGSSCGGAAGTGGSATAAT